MTAEEALKHLKAGNKRYVKGDLKHPHTDPQRRHELAEAQHPFAVVLSCADSRVVPELLFDQGLGDLFVIRVAGNIAKEKVIGSIEYAVKFLNSKLIVVLGHENCGAVNASLGDADPGGHIGKIIEKIKPAVYMAKLMPGDHLTNAIKVNAQIVTEELKESKPILSDAVKSAGVEVVSAYYKLSSGEVEFL
ncbi:carbonic anhydrase [Roseivirga sp.]|uniref:carbonic anhydrase n=1 Tax=Roseivirga sp. TaxID=1964215 RepID=UPI003B8E0E4D